MHQTWSLLKCFLKNHTSQPLPECIVWFKYICVAFPHFSCRLFRMHQAGVYARRHKLTHEHSGWLITGWHVIVFFSFIVHIVWYDDRPWIGNWMFRMCILLLLLLYFTRKKARDELCEDDVFVQCTTQMCQLNCFIIVNESK